MPIKVKKARGVGANSGDDETLPSGDRDRSRHWTRKNTNPSDVETGQAFETCAITRSPLPEVRILLFR